MCRLLASALLPCPLLLSHSLSLTVSVSFSSPCFASATCRCQCGSDFWSPARFQRLSPLVQPLSLSLSLLLPGAIVLFVCLSALHLVQQLSLASSLSPSLPLPLFNAFSFIMQIEVFKPQAQQKKMKRITKKKTKNSKRKQKKYLPRPLVFFFALHPFEQTNLTLKLCVKYILCNLQIMIKSAGEKSSARVRKRETEVERERGREEVQEEAKIKFATERVPHSCQWGK